MVRVQVRVPLAIMFFSSGWIFCSLIGMKRDIDDYFPSAQFENVSFKMTRPVTRKRLADGCFHVFLDVGANVGAHGRFLFEPEKYNETKLAVKLFEDEFGAQRDNRDFCVFSFEPNPAHKKRLQEVSTAYKAMGWRLDFIPAGVSDHDGNMTFYHQHDEDNKEWGFSTVRNNTGGYEEHLPVIHLARWLQEEVYDRVIPTTTYGEYEKPAPKVVMKMDVEGLELIILPDLLVSGALCNTVDFVFSEFHFADEFYPMNFPEHGFVLNDQYESYRLAESAMTMMEVSPSCKTRYDTRDDETYLRDGIPLPEPNTTEN